MSRQAIVLSLHRPLLSRAADVVADAWRRSRTLTRELPRIDVTDERLLRDIGVVDCNCVAWRQPPAPGVWPGAGW